MLKREIFGRDEMPAITELQILSFSASKWSMSFVYSSKRVVADVTTGVVNQIYVKTMFFIC